MNISRTLFALLHLRNLSALRVCAALALGLWITWGVCGEAAPAYANELTLKTGEVKPELIFRRSCAVCHGERGNGDGPASINLNPRPRDFTQSSSLTRETMINAVTHGKPGTAMMPWTRKYNERQIAAVVDYIRRKFMLAALDPRIETGPQHNIPSPAAVKSVAVPADMSQPLPKGLAGDIKLGERFFMGNCAICHGKQGNGEGSRAYLLNPRPRNFHDGYSHANLNRPALFSAITTGKPGTVMPAWGKVFSDQEIANVAEFVFQAFVREKVKAK